jgi:hypothetical protein
MIFSRQFLGRPVRPARGIISILRGWVTATGYRPERHYMRGGRQSRKQAGQGG